MRSSTTTVARLIAMLVPLALVAAACGQKSGVEGSEAEELPAPAPATARSRRTPSRRPRRPGTAAPGATTAPGETTPTGETTPPGEATTVPARSGPFEPGDNDTAGVTDTEIVIGIHAPVTGASPIPQTSFDIGKDIYWQFLAESAPDQLFGRNVRVVFEDDTFNPQTAVQVCRKMVEEDGAFLLVGGGGADQITACAQYANENGIPYVSAGVNEEGLADLDTYFATTLSYAEQAPLLMEQLEERGITEIGLVVADTPSFDDADGGDQGGRRGGRDQHRLRDSDQQDAGRTRAAVRRPVAQGQRCTGRHPARFAADVHRAVPARVSTRATRRSGSARASPAA